MTLHRFLIVSLLLFCISLGAGPRLTAAQPTVDGDLSDAEYVTIATRENTNDGFGDRTEVRKIVYYADDVNDNLYLGVTGALPTNNSNGIGLWLNVRGLPGESSETELGADLDAAAHYLDGKDGGTDDNYEADFEVDYLFAITTNGTSSETDYYGLDRVGISTAADNFPSSDQSGAPVTTDFFGRADATFSFHNGGGSSQGFEAKIPYSALGSIVSEVGAIEAFAFVVTDGGKFSDETVPGNVTGGNLGTNPHFQFTSGGPFHKSKVFAPPSSISSGTWGATSTWQSGTVPFDGANVKIDGADVTLDTDATVYNLTIASGHTFTASDGNGRTLTFANGGTFLRNGTFSASDGTVGVASNGTVSVPDPMGGSNAFNNVTLTNGTLDIQTRADISGDLDIEGFGTLQLSSDQFLQVEGNAVVDGTLTLATASCDSDSELFFFDDLTINSGGALNDAGSACTVEFTDDDNDGAQTIKGTKSPISLASRLIVRNEVTLQTDVHLAGSGVLELAGGPLNSDGHLTLTSTAGGTAAISGDGFGSISGDVTYERYLAKSDDASHFRFLSAPTTTKLDDEGSGSNADNLLSGMWTQSPAGTGADGVGAASVFVYNEAADLDDSSPNLSNGWQGIGQSSGNWGQLNDLTNVSGQAPIDPGRGFLTYLYADHDFDGTDEGFPVTLTATGPMLEAENNGGNMQAINPPITFNGSDGDGASNNGWNLIANPFMAPIDWETIEQNGSDLTNVDATIYVWDAANGRYATYAADPNGNNGSLGGANTQGRYIAPFQAFFVKATGPNPSIGGIGPDQNEKAVEQTPGLKSESSGSSMPEVTLALQAQDDSTRETTALRFGEGVDSGKDPYDAYQLTPLAPDYALVASGMEDTDALFDLQSRPVPAEQDTIDLAFEITQSGSYTLAVDTLRHVPENWSVILENTDTGARHDLGAGETVSFEVSPPGSSPSASESSAIETMLSRGAPTVARAKADSSAPSYRLFVGPAAAIPVEMAGFDVRANGPETVTVSWQTASEQNNAGFVVQRRVASTPVEREETRERNGASTWTQVGFVEGAGTTSTPQTYRFVDENVPFDAEQVAYRLRQRDLDGSTTLSETRTVHLDLPTQPRLHAPFPNPARDQVTVRYEVPGHARVQGVRIALYDVIGRRVRTIVSGRPGAGRHERTMRVGALSPGPYFLRMRVDGQIRTRRFTVVR
jgi:hypothetical protein